MSGSPQRADPGLCGAMLGLGVIGLAASPGLDYLLYTVPELRKEGQDGYWTLRVFGSLHLWLFICAAIIRLERSWRLGVAKALIVLLSLGAAALANETLKLSVRRLRPDLGAYSWFAQRPFEFDSGGLSFPSGHGTTAFAGAVALSYLYPRGTPIWLAWAAACAGTRVYIRAHYFSDACGSMIVAALCATWVYNAAAPRLLPAPEELPRDRAP